MDLRGQVNFPQVICSIKSSYDIVVFIYKDSSNRTDSIIGGRAGSCQRVEEAQFVRWASCGSGTGENTECKYTCICWPRGVGTQRLHPKLNITLTQGRSINDRWFTVSDSAPKLVGMWQGANMVQKYGHPTHSKSTIGTDRGATIQSSAGQPPSALYIQFNHTN